MRYTRSSVLLLFFSLTGTGTGVRTGFLARPAIRRARSRLGAATLRDARDEWVPESRDGFRYSIELPRVPLSPLPLGLPQSFSVGFAADMPVDGNMLVGVSLSRYQYTDVFAYQSFGMQASKTFQVGGSGDTGFDVLS